MTTEGFELRLARWLERDAAGRVSNHLEHVLAATFTTRQRRSIRVPTGSGNRLLVVRPLAIGVAAFLLAALAAVGLGARLLTSTPVPALVPATNGDLVIKSEQHGDLYLADATGSNRRLLAAAAVPGATAGGDFIYDVTFSPDGSRVAFAEIVDDRETYIFVTDADGSHPRRVYNLRAFEPMGYAWSPDGRHLAVVHPTLRDDDISLVPVDDPQAVQSVPMPEGAVFGNPAFGFQLAWRGPGEGELLVFGALRSGPREPGIFAVHPDGSGFRDVARFDFDFEYVGLSPNGRWLTYFNYERGVGGVVGATTHLVDMTTGADRVISSGRVAWDQELAFSPDGTTGVMVACSKHFADCNLVVVALDGSTLPRVIGTIGGGTPKERSLLFSPDGRKIVVQEAGEAPVVIDIDSDEMVSLEGVYTVEAWRPIPATR